MSAKLVRTELPTLQEEIDRKAFETLEWLTYAVSQGRLTPHQFSTGIDVLFMTVSGLLKKDFIDLISEAQALCPTEPLEMKRSFSDGSALTTVTWTVGAEQVWMGRFGGKRAVREFDTAKEAQDWFASVGKALEAKSFREI